MLPVFHAFLKIASGVTDMVNWLGMFISYASFKSECEKSGGRELKY